jgi:spore coat polysaccharide biosynthesis protein SpsF
MNSLGMVTVRTSSSRLPEKCFQPLVGELNLIQVVVRRAMLIGCRVVITTSDDPSDDRLEQVALAEGVEIFRGALSNKIKRWTDCMSKFEASEAVIVDGDDPTFDFNVGRRALELLRAGKEFIVPSPEMTPGFFTYGFSVDALKKLCEEVPDPDTDTDVITEFVARSGLPRTEVPAKPEETTGHGLRLTVDYPEDLDFYRVLFQRVDYLDPGPIVVRSALEHDLGGLNWRRQAEFLHNQAAFNRKVTENDG